MSKIQSARIMLSAILAMKKDKFIYCPRCGSDNIYETYYEDENGEEDLDGRACEECGWEGDIGELVCK